MTELVRGMGLFLVWRHKSICIIVSLCKHAWKEVCDVKTGIDPHPLLARSCNRWWPGFITFTACKKSRFGFKRDKNAQCVSNRCKDLFKQKQYFGVRCNLKDPLKLEAEGPKMLILESLVKILIEQESTITSEKKQNKVKTPGHHRVIEKLVPPLLNFLLSKSTRKLDSKVNSSQIICLQERKHHCN